MHCYTLELRTLSVYSTQDRGNQELKEGRREYGMREYGSTKRREERKSRGTDK